MFAEPVMDLRGLEITFPFPDLSSSHDSKVRVYSSNYSTSHILTLSLSLERTYRMRLEMEALAPFYHT